MSNTSDDSFMTLVDYTKNSFFSFIYSLSSSQQLVYFSQLWSFAVKEFKKLFQYKIKNVSKAKFHQNNFRSIMQLSQISNNVIIIIITMNFSFSHPVVLININSSLLSGFGIQNQIWHQNGLFSPLLLTLVFLSFSFPHLLTLSRSWKDAQYFPPLKVIYILINIQDQVR